MRTVSLEEVYGARAPEAKARFAELRARHERLFGPAEGLRCFTSPGRTEIIGNHTDHNGGKILAASIEMDTIGVVRPNGTDTIRLASEGYPLVTLDLSGLDAAEHGPGTRALLAGMLVALRERGHAVAGFDATLSSEVIPAAGVSSSASFEMLVCEMVNALFNEGSIAVEEYAYIGQYAENVFWGKGSGLMDQMACAFGGTILLDFSRGVSVRRVDFSYDDLGLDLVLVNTGKGHADLSAEYSSVPNEMLQVASVLDVTLLAKAIGINPRGSLADLRARVGNDRALLRALHFFEECLRVDRATEALEVKDKQRMLDLIKESGNSSWKWLQNAYVPDTPAEQPLPVALALSEIFLDRIGGGACRLHGGGFAGVIMCAVPKEHTADYIDLMAEVFGRDNIYCTNVRAVGAAEIA